MRMIHVADSRPGPTYKHWRHDGIRFTHSVFGDGMWQTMRFPEDCNFSDLVQHTIQTTGVSVDESGRLPDREAGWVSKHIDFVVPAGEYRRIARGVVNLWCCWPDDNAPHVESIRLSAGDSMILCSGYAALLVEGICSCNNKSIESVRLLTVADGERSISAITDSYLFRWKRPDGPV